MRRTHIGHGLFTLCSHLFPLCSHLFPFRSRSVPGAMQFCMAAMRKTHTATMRSRNVLFAFSPPHRSASPTLILTASRLSEIHLGFSQGWIKIADGRPILSLKPRPFCVKIGVQWSFRCLILSRLSQNQSPGPKLGEDFEHATWVLLHIVSGRMGLAGVSFRTPCLGGPTNTEALMSLAKIVAELKVIAESNEERAYRILGSRPGPGIDLLIKPQVPLNGKWHVTGKTTAGSSFVSKFWIEQPLSNQKLAEMKKQANEWQLSYETEYPTVSLGGMDG